jgi:hypothetical protein
LFGYTNLPGYFGFVNLLVDVNSSVHETATQASRGSALCHEPVNGT